MGHPAEDVDGLVSIAISARHQHAFGLFDHAARLQRTPTLVTLVDQLVGNRNGAGKQLRQLLLLFSRADDVIDARSRSTSGVPTSDMYPLARHLD